MSRWTGRRRPQRMLDTNICIHIIRHKPDEVLGRLWGYAPGEVGVSAVTVAELHYGVQKSSRPAQNLEALSRFLLPLEVVAFDTDAAVTYGQLRAILQRAGTPIGPLDLLIAAQAVSLDVTLVTNNLREFARIPNIELEDWVSGGQLP